MKVLLVIAAAQFLGTGASQMLEAREGHAFAETTTFVDDFIRENKIKTIIGHYATKAQLDYIRPSEDISYYKFNRAGELSYEYKVQRSDTVLTVYTYDERSNIVSTRKSDRYSFVSHHYQYDSANRLIYTEMRRAVNFGQDRLTYVPADSMVISSERFGYVDFEGGNYKKIYYNEGGAPYMEEFYYFNEKGQLIKQEAALKMGSGRTNITFTYDAKGRLTEKLSEHILMGTYTKKYVYEYDEFDNILAMRYYNNSVYVTEFQLLYYPDTHILKAVITRDEATDFMTLLTFKDYEYFN